MTNLAHNASTVSKGPAAGEVGLTSVRRPWCPDLKAALAVYVVCGAVLLPFYRYAIDQDGTGYISAARKYAAGEWWAAVNGHWSPLLSWLLVPWFKLGVPEVLAVKMTLLLGGLLAIVAFHRLSLRFEIEPRVRTWSCLAFVPMALYYSLVHCTPDVWMLCFMLGYLAVLFKADFLGSKWSGAWCGTLAGLAFLAKSYALPFFCLHFPLVILLHAFRAGASKSWKPVVVQTAMGFVCILLIASSWVGVVSAKYGTFTLSKAGSYNWNFNNPEAGQKLSADTALLAPASDKDISAWDDPPMPPGVRGSPFDTPGVFKHWLFMMARRIAETVFFLETASLLSIPILIAGLVCLWRGRGDWREKPSWHLPLLTVLLFPSGYILLWVCERYLWLIMALTLLLGAQVVSNSLLLRRAPALRVAMTVLLALSFMIYPVKRLRDIIYSRRDLCRMAEVLKRDYGFTGRMASYNRYRESLYLSYFLGAPYYGNTRRVPTPEIPERLRSLGVDYYLVWNDYDLPAGARQPVPAFLDGHGEVAAGRFPELRIFRLHPEQGGVSP